MSSRLARRGCRAMMAVAPRLSSSAMVVSLSKAMSATMAYSRPGSPEQASKNRLKTPALTQSRKRV
jgi:hypothetical protein